MLQLTLANSGVSRIAPTTQYGSAFQREYFRTIHPVSFSRGKCTSHDKRDSPLPLKDELEASRMVKDTVLW